MRVLFIIITAVFLGNCTTSQIKEESKVVPICNFAEFDLIESKIYPPESKISKLTNKINEYKNTLIDLNKTKVTSENIEKLKLNIVERINSIYISISNSREKIGDKYNKEYNFIKAIEAYLESLEYAEEVSENEKRIQPVLNSLRKKISITRENGENFLNNKIKGIIDQASYLYLDDQIEKAENALKLAKGEMENSIFFNKKILGIYMEQAKVMNSEYTSILPKCRSSWILDNYSDNRLKQIYKRLPDRFTTSNGINFTKNIQKDGKPVFVSDIIRSDQKDSWYFARDYAEKLNLEDNCNNCYRLPSRDEVINIKGDVWFESWSLAPWGLIVGNGLFGIYSFDYIHDIVFHPFTWQSYIYPLSPDSLSEGCWDWKGRCTRTSVRTIAGDWGKGFRLVRPVY